MAGVGALAPLILTLAVAGPPHRIARQAPDGVDLTVSLSAAVSSDEALAGDVDLEFIDAVSREPLVLYVVEAPVGEQTFQVNVPVFDSQSGWFASARSEGWWSSAAYIAPGDEEVSLTLVPEGVVRFTVDGTDRGVDFLRTGQVWIAGRVGSRRVRLERGTYRGPCEVDRETDRREVLIACPFARDETVDLRVRLGPFLPLLRSDVKVAADTELGLVEPVRGAVVTGSLGSADGSSHLFALRQRNAPFSFGWSAWTDAGAVFTFEGLSPGAYELRLAGSDGDSWPVRIESLNDRIDLGQLVSAAGNLLTISFLTPGVLEVADLKPNVQAVTLGPDGEVEIRGRTFEFDERSPDGPFLWRGLPAGDYQIEVEDNRGSRWHHEVVSFFGHDRYTVELDAVPLVGRVELGGEPLEGVLVWFGGVHGFERVSFRSREEGHFSGLLPREGFWPVEVTPAPGCDPCEGSWDGDGWDGFDGREISSAGFFEIEADSDGTARVDIDLPAGSVSGHVVRRNAVSGVLEPVAGARVWVWALEEVAGERHDYLLPDNWRRRTDGSGAFEVRGLHAWEYSIRAESYIGEREIQSRPLQVRLSGDDQIDDLLLQLLDQQPVTVIVRAGGVPLSGAQTFVLHPAGSGIPVANNYSDGAGEATHDVSMDAEYVDVVVRAEGLGMNGWRFDIRDGVPIEVDLSADRGSLRVPRWQDDNFFWEARLIAPGGASIRIDTLAAVNDRGQIGEDGDQVIVRDLAPGTYSYCPADGACTRVDILPWAEARVRE